MLGTADIFEFEEFRLDRRGEGLSRRDETSAFVPLPVGSRALDVLSVLVERPGELVTKEEIMAAVWRRSVVENANLTVQIAALRRPSMERECTTRSLGEPGPWRGVREGVVMPLMRVSSAPFPSPLSEPRGGSATLG